MIKHIEDNDVAMCISLMYKSYEDNDYIGYEKNERSWIEHLCKHVREAESNPKFLAIADVDDEGKMQGFLLASAFNNYYTQEWVMDVKDCIVDHDNNNVWVVKRLFDALMVHIEQHGGRHWRADSIRAFQDCERYAEFLKRFYNAEASLSMRGQIGG